jgi:ribosomal protein S18 acetylase RimI-like enzyme
METPALRPATTQDIDALVSLYIEFHEFHVLGVPERLRKPDTYDETTLRNTLYELIQRDDAQIIVVDSAGKLVGLAEVYLHQEESHPLTVAHRYGYLQSLIISAPFRKSGLGKQLVVAAHQWVKEQHATEMRVEIWEFAQGPLHFYEALGYRTLKRDLVIDLD